MIKAFLIVIALFTTINFIAAKPTAQYKEVQKITADSTVRFDGLYVAKTLEVNTPGNKMEIYTYIRFNADGTAYSQTVSSYDPAAVAVWLGKDGRFERKGNYKISGAEISFKSSNDESPDKALEGPMRTDYNGKISAGNKLFLKITYNDGAEKEFWFEFVKTN
jgi:hypothetical protein